MKMKTISYKLDAILKINNHSHTLQLFHIFIDVFSITVVTVIDERKASYRKDGFPIRTKENALFWRPVIITITSSQPLHLTYAFFKLFRKLVRSSLEPSVA
ncbi:hypothetical protein PanWU01x14_028320 [Parasponia andersonii]|uniref:Uncharacterized protein n=1 Tax=Parasponia andersonii TaxID=3476 RepID=A0A2P5DV93_PARAD|nr:hypothetical protein PanWU01x14_028320 [Parasponia andersonii]